MTATATGFVPSVSRQAASPPASEDDARRIITAAPRALHLLRHPQRTAATQRHAEDSCLDLSQAGSRVDIVDEWGRQSFPASDPPANW
jgi:hypothetical protein